MDFPAPAKRLPLWKAVLTRIEIWCFHLFRTDLNNFTASDSREIAHACLEENLRTLWLADLTTSQCSEILVSLEKLNSQFEIDHRDLGDGRETIANFCLRFQERVTAQTASIS